MTTQKHKRTILIPLDTEPLSSESLSFTALLAKYLNATVSGLFVVNSRSLEAANLPFAFEINRFSAEERTLHQADLTRLIRKTENEARRLLKEVSLHHKITVSFSTLNGELVESAFAQPATDMLFYPRQLGQLKSQPAYKARNRIDELVVYYDSSPQSADAVHLAEQLIANHLVSKLTLLYEDIPPLEKSSELRKLGIRPRLKLVSTRDPLWLRSLHLVESNFALIPRHKLAGLSSGQLSIIFADNKSQILLLV